MSLSIYYQSFSPVFFSTIPNKIMTKINTLSSRQKTILVAISVFCMIVASYITYRCIKNRKIEKQQNDSPNLNNPVIPEDPKAKEPENKVVEDQNALEFPIIPIKKILEKPINLNNIQVKIEEPVKKTLDKLFENTPYSVDYLPVYQTVLTPENGMPTRDKMTAPIMKGSCSDGRPFIAIKVDCELQAENLAGFAEPIQNDYKNQPHLNDILILYQNNANQLIWSQLPVGGTFEPKFFDWNFTYEDGEGPTKSQKDFFAAVQTLLQTGESKDLKGLSWHIPVEENA